MGHSSRSFFIDVGPYAGVGFSLPLLLFLVAAAAALVAGSAADMLLPFQSRHGRRFPTARSSPTRGLCVQYQSFSWRNGPPRPPRSRGSASSGPRPYFLKSFATFTHADLILHRGILSLRPIRSSKARTPSCEETKVGRVYLVSKRLSCDFYADAERNPLRSVLTIWENLCTHHCESLAALRLYGSFCMDSVGPRDVC